MSKRLLIANWKMNSDRKHSAAWVQHVARFLTDSPLSEIWVAPPFTLIPAINEQRATTPLVLGSQNVHAEPEGAFTGEISASMLLEIGCQFAIVGHSERRHVFGESDELCAARASGALNQKLEVIFCVGEKLEERKTGKTTAVIERQLSSLVKNISSLRGITIAYEPVWAIGTGLAATPAEISEVHSWIESFLKNQFGQANSIQVVYGGSVSPENAAQILSAPHVSGALIGKASLSSENMEAFWNISEKLPALR